MYPYRIQCDLMFSSLFQLDKLINFLETNDVSATRDKTLVFAETKRTVDFLETMLSRVRIRTSAIHGDKTQVCNTVLYINMQGVPSARGPGLG